MKYYYTTQTDITDDGMIWYRIGDMQKNTWGEWQKLKYVWEM